MAELSVRLLLSGLAVFVAGFAGLPPFMSTLQIAVMQSAVGIFAFILERRKMRLPAISGLIACADAIMIEMLLASVTKSPALETFGLIALAPIIYSAARFGSNPFLMAPVAAAGFVGSQMFFNHMTLPSQNILGYALSFLIVGCLAKPLTAGETVYIEVEKLVADSDAVPVAHLAVVEGQMIELRENYRQLRDAYRDLDRKSSKDRVAAALADITGSTFGSGYFGLCERVAEACGADAVLLYTVAQLGDQFTVRGAAGDTSESQLTEAIDVRSRQAVATIRNQADQASKAIDPNRPCGNLVLQKDGKVTGLMTVVARDKDSLFEALESLQPCSTIISNLVAKEQEHELLERRLTEVEVMYAVVAHSEGACTKSEIASRIAREFQSILQVEHLSIHLLEGDDHRVLASEGRDVNIMNSLEFSTGPGLEGWKAGGCDELWLPDVRVSNMLSSEAIVRSRVGSFVTIPIPGDHGVTGFINAASMRVGGIDRSEIKTLRACAAELAHQFRRPEQPAQAEMGMLSPRSFVEQVGKRAGVVVTLIPGQFKDFEHKFGKAAMSHVMRTLSLRIRPHVPYGGLMCKHPDGMIMAFLPGSERDYASEWADDLVAMNLSQDLRTPDGSNRVPIQLRVKVAATNPQFNQFLVGSGS